MLTIGIYVRIMSIQTPIRIRREYDEKHYHDGLFEGASAGHYMYRCQIFFASVEAAERKQHPLKSRIAVVSKPDNQGGLVLAASPLVKKSMA